MTKSKYYKHPQYGMVYGESLPTPEGALAWTYLTKPKNPPAPKEGEKPGEPRYETTLLLDKDSKEVKAFRKVVKDMTDEMLVLFNKGRGASLGECKLFGKYEDGDEADLEKYPYYKNKWCLVGRNAKPVKAVDPTRKVIDCVNVLGGMKGKFVVTPLITAHGISYKLEAVQVTGDDGTRYAGTARDAVELFGACEDETEAEETTEKPAAKRGRPAKQGKEAALDLL